MKTIGKNIKSIGSPGFYYFVMILRALSAILITNTHLDSIYPDNAKSLAVGGLLGDCLFFAISGFCLANIGDIGFFRWYGKRILRIYPSVFSIMIIYGIVFKIQFGWLGFLRLFIYPTNYHFIASIMLLYIPFYFIMRSKFFSAHLLQVMLSLGIIWLLCYIIIFDKSVRLDTATQPLTKFLFIEVMLFGAYISKNNESFINRKSLVKFPVCVLSCMAYFLIKIVIGKYNLKNFQCIIFVSLFIATGAIMVAFCSIENKLKKCSALNRICAFLAPLTLEIYIVQHRIIFAVAELEKIIFPFNLLITIGLIIISAYILNRMVYCIVSIIKTKVFRVRHNKV